MPEASTTHKAPSIELPGATMLVELRRLILLALVCSLIYSILGTASASICPGGFDGSGGYLDANGDPTDVAPNCLSLTLRPNPLLFIVFALVALGALSSVLKKSKTESDALRYIKSAATVVVVLTVVCIVVSQIWFRNLPIADWDGVNTNFIYPFPFGLVDMQITPMEG